MFFIDIILLLNFYILLIILIMHFFSFFFFGTIKIFKFQSYYSNSNCLKEITMIAKTYHIILIDNTQIVNSTLNPYLHFAILK